MTREEFAEMARNAVETACNNAETKQGITLGREVIFKLYGTGVGGKNVGFDELVSRIFISEDVFYRLIDLFAIEIVDQRPVIFTRVSDHPPGPLSECWNGLDGPFKQLLAYEILRRSSH